MPSTKDIILEQVRDDEQAWTALVAEVPHDRMDEPGPMGDWSFKDLVSHVLAWRNRTIGRLEAAAAAAPRPPHPWPADISADDEPINAWFRDEAAHRSADELLAEYAGSFATLTGAVAALPEEQFIAEVPDSPGAFRWRDTEGELASDFTGHLRDHVDDVRAWLARG